MRKLFSSMVQSNGSAILRRNKTKRYVSFLIEFINPRVQVRMYLTTAFVEYLDLCLKDIIAQVRLSILSNKFFTADNDKLF